MHRRFHKRRWTLTCFLAAMVILPTAAVLQKDNDAQNKSAAHAYAEKRGCCTVCFMECGFRRLWLGGRNRTSSSRNFGGTAGTKASADAGEKPYPESWNLSSDTSVQRTSYGTYSGTRFFSLFSAGQVQNKTSIPNNTLIAESTAAPAFTIETNGEPQVLIMHTHTTESFEPYVRQNFDPAFNYRTTDPAYNMVSVGDAITAQLEAAGIGVIHNATIHDYPLTMVPMTAVLKQSGRFYSSIRLFGWCWTFIGTQFKRITR